MEGQMFGTLYNLTLCGCRAIWKGLKFSRTAIADFIQNQSYSTRRNKGDASSPPPPVLRFLKIFLR